METSSVADCDGSSSADVRSALTVRGARGVAQGVVQARVFRAIQLTLCVTVAPADCSGRHDCVWWLCDNDNQQSRGLYRVG